MVCKKVNVVRTVLCKKFAMKDMLTVLYNGEEGIEFRLHGIGISMGFGCY